MKDKYQYAALAKEANIIKMQLDNGNINIHELRRFLIKFLEASNIIDKPPSKSDEGFLKHLNLLRSKEGECKKK